MSAASAVGAESSGSDEELDATQAVEQLQTLQESLTGLEQMLQPLLQTPLQNLTAQLPSAQAAKLQAALAYASSALFFIYLRTAGESTETHPVKKELDRVKKYLKKIADASAPAAAPAATSGAPTHKLDKAAAKRFVTSQLQGQTAAKGKANAVAIVVDSDSDASSDDEEESTPTPAPVVAAAAAALKAAPASAKKSSAAAQQSRNAPTPTSPTSHKRGTETQKRESNKKHQKRQKK